MLTLKILNNQDYEKIAERYPQRIKKKIIDSWGFADTHRDIAFVRSRRSVGDLAPVVMHELIELVATVSPHDEAGIRFKGKKPEAPQITYSAPPPPTYTQSPQEQEFFEKFWKPIGIPYAQDLYKMYQEYGIPQEKSEYELSKEVFEPTSRQIGGLLQSQLTAPFGGLQQFDLSSMGGLLQSDLNAPFGGLQQFDLSSMGGLLQSDLNAPFGGLQQSSLTAPLGESLRSDLAAPLQLSDDVWSKIWQKSRERALGEFDPISRQASQRFAGMGALESSGQVGKYFENLDMAKAKSIEDLAVNQAISEWNEKKAAKQLNYENILQYSNLANTQAMNEWSAQQAAKQAGYGNMFQYANLANTQAMNEWSAQQAAKQAGYGNMFQYANLSDVQAMNRWSAQQAAKQAGYENMFRYSDVANAQAMNKWNAEQAAKQAAYGNMFQYSNLANTQAINEYNARQAAAQLPIENIFRYLGYQPSANLPQAQIPYGIATPQYATPFIKPGTQGELSGFQQAMTWGSPIYSDIMKQKGYGVSAPGVQDIMQLALTGAMVACLPFNTSIETNEGMIKIQDIKVGDEVKGGIVIVTNSIPVNPEHKFYRFVFENGEVIASRNHPFFDIPLRVEESDVVSERTYDILTDSGFYYINGVKVDSTLRN